MIKALTHQQIRELRFSLEEVDLRCDIISQLPLELSQIILQHLPLYQLFQARRVSSKWRQILSSAQTVEPLLRDWYHPKRDVDRGSQIPAGLSADSVAYLKAKYIDAYCTGHPFTYASHEWDCLETYLDLNLVAYADGIMAWVDKKDSDFVKSLDLRTGQKWSFLPEARTGVRAVATSSSMVAALGSGRCHVWNYRTGESYTLLLPSARLANIAVSGESLAIRSEPVQHEASLRIEVVTWTLKDKKTYSFSVASSRIRSRSAYASRTMLDNEGESVLFFEWVEDRSERPKPSQFHYLRTSLDGNVLTQGVIETPDLMEYNMYTQVTVPKEANGQAVIWPFAKAQNRSNDLSELMLICYNFHEDRLEVRTRIVPGLRVDQSTVINLFCWKNAAYLLTYEHECFDLRVIDLHDSTCIEAKMNFYFNYYQKYPVLSERDVSQTILFGDEIFIIIALGKGFSVWCFDANVQLFKEDNHYAQQRKMNMDRRLLEAEHKEHRLR